VLFDHYLAQVNADALAERNPARLAPTLQFGLQSQCEFDRFRRSGEHQKERITRGLDLFALGKSCPLPADQPAVILEKAGDLPFSQPLLQRCRSDNIGEHQRQQASAMLAAKLLDSSAVLQCHFEVHRE